MWIDGDTVRLKICKVILLKARIRKENDHYAISSVLMNWQNDETCRNSKTIKYSWTWLFTHIWTFYLLPSVSETGWNLLTFHPPLHPRCLGGQLAAGAGTCGRPVWGLPSALSPPPARRDSQDDGWDQHQTKEGRWHWWGGGGRADGRIASQKMRNTKKKILQLSVYFFY